MLNFFFKSDLYSWSVGSTAKVNEHSAVALSIPEYVRLALIIMIHSLPLHTSVSAPSPGPSPARLLVHLAACSRRVLAP